MNPKCKRAFAVVHDNHNSDRIKICENARERGFALLLRFVQVEASLKLLRYWERTKDGWPDRLDFIDARWRPLRDLKSIDNKKYEVLIGVGGKSLKVTRNKIAHEGHNLEKEEYMLMTEVTDWALGELRRRLPTEQALAEKENRMRKRPVDKGR